MTNPERRSDFSDVRVPPLAPDFAQRVVRQAKQQRRRNSTLRVTLGLGASLALAVLVVRPIQTPRLAPARAGAPSSAASALAANDLSDGDASDALDPQEEDPGDYFFPDAEPDPQSDSQSELQPVTDDDLPATDAEGAEGNEE
jgi:hypothetical protein